MAETITPAQIKDEFEELIDDTLDEDFTYGIMSEAIVYPLTR